MDKYFLLEQLHIFFFFLFPVFTQPHLETKPTHKVPPTEIFLTPKPGTMDWTFASEEHQGFLNDIMDRLRQRINQRRVLMKPTFQDFDRCSENKIMIKLNIFWKHILIVNIFHYCFNLLWKLFFFKWWYVQLYYNIKTKYQIEICPFLQVTTLGKLFISLLKLCSHAIPKKTTFSTANDFLKTNHGSL